MAALDLITLADLKSYRPLGTGRDAMLRVWITTASRVIENYLGRRIRYRAPLEVASGDDLVADVAIANGSLALAGQPAGGRTLVVSVTDADRSLTAGLLTVTGTVGGVAGVTENFDLAAEIQQDFDGDGFMRLYGSKFFTAISGAAVSGASGATAADKVRLGVSLGYVEYHTIPGGCEHWTLEWPVISILEVNEDASAVYAAAAALVAGTDYRLDKNEGKLTRVASQVPFSWDASWRAVRDVYSGGYASIAAVPQEIKDVCRRLVLLSFQEVENNWLGKSGASDPAGNWTRFGPATLTKEMRDQLQPYRRRRFLTDTGEREFDLEAA